MAYNPLDKRPGLFKRRNAGERRGPTPVGKALGTVLLILGVVLIAIGATIGFVQGVKEPPATDNTAVVTTTTAAETTTTTAVQTTTTVSQTTTTAVL